MARPRAAGAWSTLVDPVALQTVSRRARLNGSRAATAAATLARRPIVEEDSEESLSAEGERKAASDDAPLDRPSAQGAVGAPLPLRTRSSVVRSRASHAPLSPRAARRLGDFGTFRQGFLGSAAHSKLEHLSIALATGRLQRAKAAFLALEATLGYRRRKLPDDGLGSGQAFVAERVDSHLPSLGEVVPPSIHASFIRRFFVDAIEAQTDGRTKDQNRLEREALAWLRNLRDNGSSWGELDHNVVASALKGMLRLASPASDPLGLMPWIMPTSDGRAKRPTAPTMPNVLSSIVFATSHPSYLGDLSAEAAWHALRRLAQAANRRDVLDSLEDAKTAIWPAAARHSEHIDRSAQSQLDPVTRPPKTTDAASDAVEVPLRLGHLLSNVGAIPDSSQHVGDPYERQLLLENAGYAAAQAEWYDTSKQGHLQGIANEPRMKGEGLQQWMWKWHSALVSEFERSLPQALKRKVDTGGELLELLPPEQLSKTIVIEVIRSMGHRDVPDGAKSIALYVAVGKAIENEWRSHILQRVPAVQKKLLASIRRARSAAEGKRGEEATVRRLWREEQTSSLGSSHPDNLVDWSLAQRAKVGAAGVKALVEQARVERQTVMPDGSTYTESQPAFFSSFQYLQGKRVGVLKLNDVVASSLERDPADVPLHPRFLPMLAPPLPWTMPEGGSYLVHGAPFMRYADSVEQFIHVNEAHKSGALEYVYRGLDKLGTAAWTINRRVFETMGAVWNDGRAMAGIPVRDPHINIVDPAAEEALSSEDTESSLDPKGRFSQRQALRALLSARRSAYGQRCSVNYQLEIARAFVGETFYFPHNIDFRGRAYPIPSNLNHIGNDIARSLLTFANRRPLGGSGLKWLKIHVANKAGYDKASLDEREAFAHDHLSDIFDSADKPLEGRQWWAQSDDPWQTLAACMELAEALRAPDPERYESSLPIHQDGSCNGLQHYAALGGDVEGGREVNLLAGTRPGDVYSKVAADVSALVDQDAERGHEVALAVRGRIARKIVKQTVMTTVYGVTFVGAREQIKRQLKDLHVVPVQHLFSTASYIANLVLRSIGTVFAGATAIQEWLTHAARLVSKSLDPAAGRDGKGDEFMTSMTWTTPLGLVVCQPYRKMNKTQVNTLMQTVFIHDPGLPGEADSRSQASAFPPNFIHSLDATHMLLTALSCDDLTFAAVHDSFWTHAADVDELNARLRAAFVQLHETPILQNLAEEIRQRFATHVVPRHAISREQATALARLGVQIPSDIDEIPLGRLLPPLPVRGALDVRSVLESPYFFA